jgi:biotin transport system substrate-specific component
MTTAAASLNARTLARDALLVLGGSLVLALSAQIKVPLPWTPVPVTGQTLAVMLLGVALGLPRAPLAALLYLAEGSLGLPVFAQGVLFGPTAGYLVGFVAGAALTGWLADKGLCRTVARAALACTAGEAVVYLFGLAVLAFYVPADQLLVQGLWPFLPGALIKAAIAATAAPWLRRFAPASNGGR